MQVSLNAYACKFARSCSSPANAKATFTRQRTKNWFVRCLKLTHYQQWIVSVHSRVSSQNLPDFRSAGIMYRTIHIPALLGSSHKRPVQSDAANLEKGGHVLAALAVLDELPGVLNLLPG